ncbi:MAG: NADP-dependent oxidoreductase, partial [Promethearchaeota archaeon]
MTSKVNRQWCIASRPTDVIQPANFTWKEVPVPTPDEGEILVRNI